MKEISFIMKENSIPIDNGSFKQAEKLFFTCFHAEKGLIHTLRRWGSVTGSTFPGCSGSSPAPLRGVTGNSAGTVRTSLQKNSIPESIPVRIDLPGSGLVEGTCIDPVPFILRAGGHTKEYPGCPGKEQGRKKDLLCPFPAGEGLCKIFTCHTQNILYSSISNTWKAMVARSPTRVRMEMTVKTMDLYIFPPFISQRGYS